VPMPGAGGKEMTVNSPFWVVGSEKTKPRRAPEVGEHSDEILRAGGYDQAEIERLRKANVVA
jgi:crotonobetainyl-CoA:carnitine CoA-transferase CaiB-like acyl-CoA transferase